MNRQRAATAMHLGTDPAAMHAAVTPVWRRGRQALKSRPGGLPCTIRNPLLQLITHEYTWQCLIPLSFADGQARLRSTVWSANV
jgi:hypothetical protein